MEYRGLPVELHELLFNFTNEELLANPLDIVHNVIRMNAMLAGGMRGLIATIDFEHPDEEEKTIE